MKILFPVAEAVPFAKTGGLADVAGALPQALARLGHEVHVVMPYYQAVARLGVVRPSKTVSMRVPLAGADLEAQIFQIRQGQNGPFVHFIAYDPFFDRPELYRNPTGDYPDNAARFTFFARAVMEFAKKSRQKWDIIHCHDWHTGLIPVYCKTLYASEPAFQKARCLMTIHNLAYQGVFPRDSLSAAGLPDSLFAVEALEYWGQVNFLKAGLVFSDWNSTVSPTYAQEIQTPDVGYGLDGVLRSRKSVLSGILNGLDYSVWDPSIDTLLPVNFKSGDWAAKAKMKKNLMEEQGLHPVEGAPLVGIISRLDDQKGFDLLASVIGPLMALHLQMIVLGTGEKKYHELFFQTKAQYARKLALNLTFNNALSHRIYGASDLFLMPSKYEPCGLGQMISMRYGAIPIVRRTGGLADTVREYDGQNGNGFLFGPYQGPALLEAVKRALSVYADTNAWHVLQKNAMAEDFSWDRSARSYQALYETIRMPKNRATH